MKKIHALLSSVLAPAAVLAAAALFALCLSSCQNGGDTTNIYILSGAAKEENLNYESLSIPLATATDDNIPLTIFAQRLQVLFHRERVHDIIVLFAQG